MRLFGVLVLMGLMALLSGRLISGLYPTAWRRFARHLFVGGGVVAVGAWLTWVVGRSVGADDAASAGMFITAICLVSSLLMAVTALIWGPLTGLLRPKAHTVNPGRRQLLASAVGVLPAASASAGPIGAGAALAQPVIRRVRVPVPGLPAAWSGLKILQLTDVHLGTFIEVDQIEAALAAAKPHAPDLVLLTGDVADDYGKLGPALEAIEAFGAPLGAFACYGNHELYRGREGARQIYARSKVQLLCETGRLLEREGAQLWLCAADDPGTLGKEHRPFLDRSVRAAVAGCPDDVPLKILMSHRPEGFETAAQLGVTLTLAGHTHGGQVGLFGRSLFEPILPKSYLLGLYRHGDAHLYTSAGLGHWFPFRLNCPCEAALIELQAT